MAKEAKKAVKLSADYVDVCGGIKGPNRLQVPKTSTAAKKTGGAKKK